MRESRGPAAQPSSLGAGSGHLRRPPQHNSIKAIFAFLIKTVHNPPLPEPIPRHVVNGKLSRGDFVNGKLVNIFDEKQ